MHRSISELIARSKVSDIEWFEQRKRDDEESWTKKQLFTATILPKLTRARAVHYKKWLRGFTANEGKPTHFYNYKMPDNFYLALEDIEIIGLYGSMSVNIIAADGIEISGTLGHCSVFYMGKFTTQGIFVPIYSNTIV